MNMWKQQATVSSVRGAVTIIDLIGFTPSDIIAAVSSCIADNNNQQQDPASSSSSAASAFLQNALNNIALEFQLVASSGLHVRSGVLPIAIGALLPPIKSMTVSNQLGTKRPRNEEEPGSNSSSAEGNSAPTTSTPSVTWLYHFTDVLDSIHSSSTTSTIPSTATHWSRGSSWEEVRRRVLSQLVAATMGLCTTTSSTSRESSTTVTSSSMTTYLNALLSCVAVTSRCFNRAPRVIQHTTKGHQCSSPIVSDIQEDVDDDIITVPAPINASTATGGDELPPAVVLLMVPSSMSSTATTTGDDTTHSEHDDRALSQVARIMLQLNMRLVLCIGGSNGTADDATPCATSHRLRSLALSTRGFWGPSSSSESSQEHEVQMMSIPQVLGFAISMMMSRNNSSKREDVNVGDCNKQLQQVVNVLLTGKAIKGGALLGSLLCAFPLHPNHVFHADDRGTTYIDTRNMSILNPEVVAAATFLAEEKNLMDKASLVGQSLSSSSTMVKSEVGGITIPRQRTAPLATGNGRGGNGAGVTPKIDTSLTKKEGTS